MTYIRTGLCLRDLREVNPVVALPVTQTVFMSVRLAVPPSSLVQLLKLINRMRPVHFHIDADPAVQITLRKHNMQVGNLALDDRGLGFASLLVGRDPYRRRLVTKQLVESRMEILAHVVGHLVKPVRFMKVNIVDRYSCIR